MQNSKDKIENQGGMKAGEDATKAIEDALGKAIATVLGGARGAAIARESTRIDPGDLRHAIEDLYGEDDAYFAGAPYRDPSHNETEEERMQELRKLQKD